MLFLPVLIFLWVYISIAIATRADADNPLRRPADEIRAELLELTPIGTSMADVIKLIDSNETWEWWDRRVVPAGFPTGVTVDDRVGEQSIRVELGSYQSFYRAFVTAWWGFDEHGYLIAIRVRKP